MGPAVGMEFGASLSTPVPSPEILGPHPSPKIGEVDWSQEALSSMPTTVGLMSCSECNMLK